MSQAKINIGIIDLNAIIYKYAFGFRNSELKNLQDNGGIFGLFLIMKKYCQKFDIKKFFLSTEGKKNFKKIFFNEYKKNRRPIPDFIKEQLILAKKIIELLSFKFIYHNDLEGDDIIGLICKIVSKLNNIHTYIFTTDKDLLQLCSDNISIILIKKKHHIISNKNKVKDLIGVFPEQISEYLALVGDPSDNFKGVPHIGKKTGQKLLFKFKTLDNLFLNINEIKNEKIKNLIIKHKKEIYKYKKIASLYHKEFHNNEINEEINKYIIEPMIYNHEYRNNFNNIMEKLNFSDFINFYDSFYTPTK